jgi:hypothetical protein
VKFFLGKCFKEDCSFSHELKEAPSRAVLDGAVGRFREKLDQCVAKQATEKWEGGEQAPPPPGNRCWDATGTGRQPMMCLSAAVPSTPDLPMGTGRVWTPKASAQRPLALLTVGALSGGGSQRRERSGQAPGHAGPTVGWRRTTPDEGRPLRMSLFFN